ncbi:unnamed protein product (macronuclear) [Paramecium tetraurelia]|uniref:Uncharacterized protein n=1 Tax=Paramecium tetraurelia TaxID=5888 RepID=A0DZP8_PARTE|nr:uncharacterized protein GSPATT00021683001 [Paramecium tetraurelia]CAK88515.1 unnamed protein product [Paramecium tetraurelia]|eukprot:XP_001455912.1 hypothetical protein (macronuclear) [Paramecium tetraurelia strain d4-2]
MARKILADEWLKGDVKDVEFKKKITGKKGQLLVELQKSYKGDKRFKLDEKFNDDLNVEKLNKKFKDLQQDLIEESSDEEQDLEKEIDEKELQIKSYQDEVNQQLQILAKLMPDDAAFISYQKKPDKKKYNLIVPKFDPNNIDQRLIKKNEEKKIEQAKKQIKTEIVKGIDKKTIKIEKANKLLQRVKEKQEIKLNIDRGAWKNIIQEEGPKGLFS